MEDTILKKIKQNKSIKELLEFGIINIDKPSGPTSFKVSEFIKKKFRLKKTSHFGTLDPKVTGILPVALSRACKLTGFFIGENKKYIGIMRIHKDIDLEEIKKEINKNFIGDIIQKPPVKSRVKREERIRKIISFELIEKEGFDILFEVECQGGTYIRKLIHDLGESLGIGAHMLELRRTKAGIFSENNEIYPCKNLYEIEKAFDEYDNGNEELLKEIIIPGEIVSELYPVVIVKEQSMEKLLTGKPVFLEDIIDKTKISEIKNNNLICVFSNENFIGIYKRVNQDNNQGDLFAKPEFVLQPVM